MESNLSPILKDLNEKQREAVLTTEGPVLVFAGAGSGKTRALTHRIAYLIKEKNVGPWQVLAVTFTNKAAGEMRERITQLLGARGKYSYDLPTIGTFHSVCVRILRKHIHFLDFENNFAIYDDTDQLILMKRVMEELQIPEKELNPRAILSHISGAKNELITPKRYAESLATSSFTEKVARLYEAYQHGLKKNNALDFDDLLMKTVELFQKQSAVLDEYQEKFRYIHVDEYQDTNHTQYVFTNLLAEKYRNLCVIGDSDQSIYSWRGANIRNILEFEKDYPDAKVITMEQNYRSTQAILDTANKVITKNKARKEKRLWTARGGGEKLRLFVAENERHEGDLVANEIAAAVKGHEVPDYRDFVVLYRTNAQSRVLEEVFLRYGIPYKIIGGIRFYERKEIKDMLAYLRVIQNPSDSVNLLRIINIPQRNIGPKTLERLQNYTNIHDVSLFTALMEAHTIADLPDAKKESIERFVKLIRHLEKENSNSPAASVIKYVLAETGYKKMLDDGSVEGEARLENIAELISVASKYNKLEPGMSLSIFLEEVSLVSDLDSLDEKENAVTLMTLHSAKGLEFPWVFITGLEDGLLPHARSLLTPQELEEERRLFYVGVTRAMDRLYLLYAKNRMLYGESQDTIPSQFLSDIPPELIDGYEERIHRPLAEIGEKPIPIEEGVEFFIGETVRHRTFGEGIITDRKGGVVTVRFNDPKIGVKKLAASIAPLEKVL